MEKRQRFANIDPNVKTFFSGDEDGSISCDASGKMSWVASHVRSIRCSQCWEVEVSRSNLFVIMTFPHKDFNDLSWYFSAKELKHRACCVKSWSPMHQGLPNLTRWTGHWQDHTSRILRVMLFSIFLLYPGWTQEQHRTGRSCCW